MPDAALVGEILRRGCNYQQVIEEGELDAAASGWLRSVSRWPVGGKIDRLAVPAPVFWKNDEWLIAVRNAQGDSRLRIVAEADFDHFERADIEVDAFGLIVDTDGHEPDPRFRAALSVFEALPSAIARPDSLGEVSAGSRTCAGVFLIPGGGAGRTIESLLVPLVTARFGPSLEQHARRYVREWIEERDGAKGADFKELQKPAGPEKSLLSAVVALLKPGKPIVASLSDHSWVPADPDNVPELRPLVSFLRDLLA